MRAVVDDDGHLSPGAQRALDDAFQEGARVAAQIGLDAVQSRTLASALATHVLRRETLRRQLPAGTTEQAIEELLAHDTRLSLELTFGKDAAAESTRTVSAPPSVSREISVMFR